MEPLTGALVLCASLVACLALYLSLPQQTWLRQPLPARTARIGAAALWLASLPVLVSAGFSAASTAFVACLLPMLWLGLLPFFRLWVAGHATARRKTAIDDGLATGSASQKPPIVPHWWAKSSIGVGLGLSLAVALSGLWAWWGPGGIGAPDKVQFNMWIVTPVWMLALSFVYLFRNGWRALWWFGGANLAAWTLLWLARMNGHA